MLTPGYSHVIITISVYGSSHDPKFTIECLSSGNQWARRIGLCNQMKLKVHEQANWKLVSVIIVVA